MINHPKPETNSTNRILESRTRRNEAHVLSSTYCDPPESPNLNEELFGAENYPANFTKSLPHNQYGMLENAADYEALVDLINQIAASDFSTLSKGLQAGSAQTTRTDGTKPEWRGWESPRAGHYYSLQGADSNKVGMDPPPTLGSEELSAEMAEVYALALLRDVPFQKFTIPGSVSNEQIPNSTIMIDQVISALQNLDWFQTTGKPLDIQARRRRAARKHEFGTGQGDIYNPADSQFMDDHNHFRGSSPGCQQGPYVSQFLINGNPVIKDSNDPSQYTESEIRYGVQVIDQRIRTLPPHEDYMVHWAAYLDVQNGANYGGDTEAAFNRNPNTATNGRRRFIATPRDLASYVRLDALYQAYLNACLLMLPSFQLQQPVTHVGTGIEGPGFPDKTPSDPRQGFASFGGPHILSLVTEVATRCLKAVRRQKYNYHRRCRPERMGGLLTVAANTSEPTITGMGTDTRQALEDMLDNPGSNSKSIKALLDLIAGFNSDLLAGTNGSVADPHINPIVQPAWLNDAQNYLLPMAYAEGSPLHPSYGAGHATVAGGCVTILKAFFDTVDTSPSTAPEAKAWPTGIDIFQATEDGNALTKVTGANLTMEGELNKLAANISIARNMAGVHYYSDYFDSVRMGERIAASILIEQMYHYDEPVEFDFHSFDGDHVHIYKSGHGAERPDITITRRNSAGAMVNEPFEDWWCRHVKEIPQPDIALARHQEAQSTSA